MPVRPENRCWPDKPGNEVHASPTAALVEHHEEQVALAGDDVVVVRDVVEAVEEQPGDVADRLPGGRA